MPDKEAKKLNKTIDHALESDPNKAEELTDNKALNYFIGLVMKETQGKADVQKAKKILCREMVKTALVNEVNKENTDLESS